MRPAKNEESFLRSPFGSYWLGSDTCLLWCHSPELVGAYAWGRPSENDTRKVVRLFDGMFQLAPRFDVLLDGSEIERVESGSMMVFLEWARGRLPELEKRVRSGVGVIAEGLAGVTLAGINPALGGPHPVTVVYDAREAFRQLLPCGGDALCDEVRGIVDEARGLSPLLARLRQLLARDVRLSIEEAAHGLGLSVRSLQRELREAGRSYRTEQKEARFVAAERLLEGDEKLAAVATQVGLTEAGLTRLVRARTGLTPGELRKKAREDRQE